MPFLSSLPILRYMGRPISSLHTGLGLDYCQRHSVMSVSFLPSALGTEVIHAYSLMTFYFADPVHILSMLLIFTDVKQYPNLIKTLCFLLKAYRPRDQKTAITKRSITVSGKLLSVYLDYPYIQPISSLGHAVMLGSEPKPTKSDHLAVPLLLALVGTLPELVSRIPLAII